MAGLNNDEVKNWMKVFYGTRSFSTEFSRALHLLYITITLI
jgi:hypothetical protein